MGQMGTLHDEDRLDTYELVMRMIDSIGCLPEGRLEEASSIMETSRSYLSQIMRRKRIATIDRCMVWANRLYTKAGVKVTVTVTPDRKIFYSVRHGKNNSVDGCIRPINKRKIIPPDKR